MENTKEHNKSLRKDNGFIESNLDEGIDENILKEKIYDNEDNQSSQSCLEEEAAENNTDSSISSSSSDDLTLPGPLQWLRQQMKLNSNPQNILKMLLPTTSSTKLSNYESWDMILQLLAQPLNKRRKLPNLNTMEDFINLLKRSKNIIVLTGAGVSVSCGIPDFRSKDGLYARLAKDYPTLPDPQAIFDISYFKYDPRPFFKIAKEIYPGRFEPSLSHRFIRYLEKRNKLLRNYTQNIDTLENVAGIKNVIECHGSFATASCTKCGYQVDAETIRRDIYDQVVPLCTLCKDDVDEEEKLIMHSQTTPSYTHGESSHTDISMTQDKEPTPKSATKENSNLLKDYHKDMSLDEDDDGGGNCGRGNDSCSTDDEYNDYGYQISSAYAIATGPPGSRKRPHRAVMKPDIVFFGEGLGEKFHETLNVDKDDCDLLLVMGSSMKVRPVSLIPNSIPSNIPQILINKEPLPHLNFDIEFLGDCDTIIAEIINRLRSEDDLDLRELSGSMGKLEPNDSPETKLIATTNASSTSSADLSGDADAYLVDNITVNNNSRYPVAKKVKYEGGPYATASDTDRGPGLEPEPLATLATREEVYVFDHVYQLLDDNHQKSSSSSSAAPEDPHGYVWREKFSRIQAWDTVCQFYYENFMKSDPGSADDQTASPSRRALNLTNGPPLNVPPPYPVLLVKKVKSKGPLKFDQTEESKEDAERSSIQEDGSRYFTNPILTRNIAAEQCSSGDPPGNYVLSGLLPPSPHTGTIQRNGTDVGDLTVAEFETTYLRTMVDPNGIISHLPERSFLYIPPNRCVFPEAEIKATPYNASVNKRCKVVEGCEGREKANIQ